VPGGHSLIVLFIIGIQPLGRFGQRSELSQSGDWYSSGTQQPGQVLRGGCHYFPPLLDVPTFATTCLHVRHDVRDPSCGR